METDQAMPQAILRDNVLRPLEEQQRRVVQRKEVRKRREPASTSGAPTRRT
jgi:hypothetical protein